VKQSIKVQRELEKVAALLASQGISFDAAAVNATVPEDVETEADAVLLYIDLLGREFTEKECKECKRTFATTNPRIVGCCSNECRALGLQKLGIAWNPYKGNRERWGNQMPLNISPDALVAAKAVLPVAE